MKADEFIRLKKGDWVVYKGSTANKKRDKTKHRCEGIVLEVDKFTCIVDSYGNEKLVVRLIQPLVESEFEMFVSNCTVLSFVEKP